MSSAKQEAIVPPVQGSANIPFNRFCEVGTEFEHIREAINNMHIAGDGPFTRKCQAMLETALGVAALLLGIEPGDEVIAPSFTVLEFRAG